MQSFWRITIVMIVCTSVSTFSIAQQASSAQTPVQRYGQLSVKGNTIVDKSGKPVTLRGMSLFWSQWGGQYFNADCVKWLRDDWKCSVVRAAMGVGSDGYLQNPETEQKKEEAVIQAAIDLGIYVIIDWHSHTPETEPAKKFFSHMAEKYGKYPNLIYETYNEPIRQDWSKVLKPYHEAVIASIREHDPNNLIICGTPMWSQNVDKAADDPIAGSNIAYTLHFYAASHKQKLRDKAQAALDKGIALMVTEWGTSEASGNGKLDDVETQKWFDFLEAHHISTCNWSVMDKNETSAALKPGAPANGGWTPDQISRSGQMVRALLRSKNAGIPIPATQPN